MPGLIIMREFVQDMMLLFDGYHHAYGMYSGQLTQESDGKKMLGKRASMSGQVTVALWHKHLTGDQGLGIIPIDETSRVKFAAIDIDEYNLDLKKLNEQIQFHKIPAVLCRTKSGGGHIYFFFKEFHAAGEIQRKVRDVASLLGYGSCEIFPKQTKIHADRGDVGNWINMPYFKSHDTNRYALGANGEQLDLLAFIDYAKSMAVAPLEFLQMKLEMTEHLKEGPPCLNHLISMGFPSGTRNNGLLNLGVYAKKIDPDNWPILVENYNARYMDPPLDATEVLGIIKSLKKKDFFYMCKQTPIAQYCNAAKCRACKFGVGNGDLGMPKFGSLTKLLTVPPIWFLEVEGGGRLELTTDELQNPRLFQNKCMSHLNVMPIPPKNDTWQEIISKLLSTVNEIEVPLEATPQGMLKLHLEGFCTNRAQARSPDDLLLGKPWTSNKFHYFRMQDFLDYLDRKKFTGMPKHHIAMLLREWGAKQKFWNIRGKGINTYALPEFVIQLESFDVPNQKTEVPY